MKFLMIYPNKVMVTRAPLGIGYVASFLKKNGHEFKLFDTTFIRCGVCPGDDALREKNLQVTNPDFEKLGLVERDVDVFEELDKEIQSFKPGIIGMSTVDPNHNFGLELLKYCKEKYPEIPIIVGGPLATLVPEEIICEDCIDMIGVGECEETVVEICNNLDAGNWEGLYELSNLWVKDKNFKENGKIYKNDPKLPDISKGLAPDLEIYDKRHFLRPLGGRIYNMATVIWTRGCVFRCSYCANETFYKAANATAREYYRKKDVKELVEELAYFKKKLNLNFLMFVDDIFPLHEPEMMDEFCTLYKKHVDLPFSVNLQCKLVKEDCFAKAVDAGMRNVCIGVESGSPRVRKDILKRNYKDEDVLRVFGFAKKYKIRHSSFNIIGLPYEAREDIFQTIELNRKINPSSATVTFFHPYRGAPLRELCVKLGYIDKDAAKHEDVYRSDSQINLPQITKSELKGIMQNFQLYMKLPEEYKEIIEKQESPDRDEEEQKLREEVLLPKFREVQAKEPQWDFRKKQKWWTTDIDEESTLPQELYPGFTTPRSESRVTLPNTKPGDAGFYPLLNKKENVETRKEET